MTDTTQPGADNALCTIPPEGWHCTRAAGHEGPCAAVPEYADNFTPAQEAIYQRGLEDGKLVARGMARLNAGIAARTATHPSEPAVPARPQAIELWDGAELRYETRTTGEPGWLMHNSFGKLIRAMNLAEVELIECSLAAGGAVPAVGGDGMDDTTAIFPPELPKFMSRSGYCDDYGDDDPLALGRYRAQVNSAIRGKRGQALLRELLAALDAMPEKRLVAGELEEDGEFCALGVVGQARGLNLAAIDTYDVESLAPKFNIAEQLAREIMWVNDDHVSDSRWEWVEICGPMRRWEGHQQQIRMPNENAGFQRWQEVRNWVESHIAKEPA